MLVGQSLYFFGNAIIRPPENQKGRSEIIFQTTLKPINQIRFRLPLTDYLTQFALGIAVGHFFK